MTFPPFCTSLPQAFPHLINDRSLKIQVVADILLWLTKLVTFFGLKVIANYM